jgi:hypothetical protein
MPGQSSARQIGRAGTRPDKRTAGGQAPRPFPSITLGHMDQRGALFEGDPSPLPAPTPRGTTRYTLSASRPAEVTHAEGCERFLALVESRAVDPATLASDISEFVDFIQRQRKRRRRCHRHPQPQVAERGRATRLTAQRLATLARGLDRPVTIPLRHRPNAARPAQ